VIEIRKYRQSRFWAVYVDGRLPAAVAYRKGAVAATLNACEPSEAFLGTTNLGVRNLTECFRTRLQPVRLQPPENEGLAGFHKGCPPGARALHPQTVPSPAGSRKGPRATSGRQWRIWKCG